MRTYFVTPVCHHVPDIKLNFNDARGYCQALGGDLAILDSDGLFSYFRTIFYTKLSLGRRVWIGLRDMPGGNSQEWIDGKPLYYSKLAAGQPDGIADDCYIMSGLGSNLWYDENCSRPLNFVCQKGM